MRAIQTDLGWVMTTLTFQSRFADKVADGRKRRTIRPTRKRPIRIGDTLSLRKWSGRAYHSPQVELKSVVCAGVQLVRIEPSESSVNPVSRLFRDGVEQDATQAHWFALDDGFECWGDMVLFFQESHGLPFSGEMIQW